MLPSISETYEKLIYNQLYKYFKAYYFQVYVVQNKVAGTALLCQKILENPETKVISLILF